jgi:uncharacterized protein
MKRDRTLIDIGILVAFYDATDPHHQTVFEFLGQYRGHLITTLSCVTETMWLLAEDDRVQTDFLQHLSLQVYHCEPLIPQDFDRIRHLNQQYKNIPTDFADLSLVAISERLDIPAIATLDSDFDIYRRYRNQPFERTFYPSQKS